MVKLNVFERVGLVAILPQENSFLTMKTIRKLKSRLLVTQEELIKYKLKSEQIPNTNPPQTRTSWDASMNDPNTPSGLVENDFEFGLKEDEIIREALKKKNDEKKLTEAEITLYEKFVEKPEVGESKEEQ